MGTPQKPPGRVVTFYSYKGGTGRSMALANVGFLLAAAGKKVLMMDWDLEAPGLHRYIHPFLDDPELEGSEGVIDFVIHYTDEASAKPTTTQLDEKWYAPYANLLRNTIPPDYEFPPGGKLDFIPAGKQDDDYAERVNSFNWTDFFVKLGGRAVLAEAFSRLRAEYDFILIDSRTGVSDTSGICTVELPDDVVVCFTLNIQSVKGASKAAGFIAGQPAKPIPGSSRRERIRLFPVAMRVGIEESDKTRLVRAYAKSRFLPLMNRDAVPTDSRDQYWGDVEVLQIPFYACGAVGVFPRIARRAGGNGSGVDEADCALGHGGGRERCSATGRYGAGRGAGDLLRGLVGQRCREGAGDCQGVRLLEP